MTQTIQKGEWLSSKQASEYFNVSKSTLIRWSNDNKIVCKRTEGGHRRYYTIKNTIKKPQLDGVGIRYIYARVSLLNQQHELDKQVKFLLDHYPGYSVIEDIASGFDYRRKGLIKLLDESTRRKISVIAIRSREILCSFGFDLIRYQFLQNNTRIIVHDEEYKPLKEQNFIMSTHGRTVSLHGNEHINYLNKSYKITETVNSQLYTTYSTEIGDLCISKVPYKRNKWIGVYLEEY
jgi:predicted site-specific integrase-resolvase